MRRVLIGANFKRIKTATRHEIKLIAQYIADRPQFAPKTIRIPKQAGLGIAPSIPKRRKIDRNKFKPRQMRDDVRDVVVRRETDADAARPATQNLDFRTPACIRNDDVTGNRQRRVIREPNPG